MINSLPNYIAPHQPQVYMNQLCPAYQNMVLQGFPSYHVQPQIGFPVALPFNFVPQTHFGGQFVPRVLPLAAPVPTGYKSSSTIKAMPLLFPPTSPSECSSTASVHEDNGKISISLKG